MHELHKYQGICNNIKALAKLSTDELDSVRRKDNKLYICYYYTKGMYHTYFHYQR